MYASALRSAVIAPPDAAPAGPPAVPCMGSDAPCVDRQPLSAFTVDVEDYFQVSGFERHVGRHQWDDHESRIVRNTQRVLRILERHAVRGTFFVLGWVAHRYPRLVREIDRGGHEIGTHSFWHRLIYEQTPAQFRADLRQSRAALEDAVGRPVTAHRAPSFSITRHSLWALEILVEEGFKVDSSIFPTYHDRYGIPQAEPRLHRLTVPAGSLWEFPPSVTRFGRIRVPVGGGYFRLYPLSWTLYCLSRIHNAGHPAMFYIHPWEIDPEQPRLKAGTRLGRFRHYVNLASNERKLNVLLRKVRFGRICDVLAQPLAAACAPALTLESA